MTRALPLLLNDGAAVHTRGPLPTFSPSQGSQSRVKLLLPSRSPHTVPSHTVILLSCPHGPGMGGRFPGKRGLGPLLSAFTRGAAAGGSGRGVLSAALSLASTPVSRVPGLPPGPDAPGLLSCMAQPLNLVTPPLLGRCLCAFPGLPAARHQVDWTAGSHRPLSIPRSLWRVGRGVGTWVCRCL